MCNQEQYLASRLGIYAHRMQNTPYGWELPEEDESDNTSTTSQAPSSSTLWLLGLLAAWMIVALLIYTAANHAKIGPGNFHGPVIDIHQNDLEHRPRLAFMPVLEGYSDQIRVHVLPVPACDCIPISNNTFEIA